MPQNRSSRASNDSTGVPMRGLFSRLTTALLGYDAFLSHAHADSLAYTERLSRLLEGRNCFLDREENQAGDRLRPVLTRALQRSRVLIVIATPSAVRSRWVNLEWSVFRPLGRRTIVVDVDEACRDAPWLLEEDPIRIMESSQALEGGNPSPHVVDAIVRSFDFSSRVTLARRILAAGALAVVLAAGLAIRFGLEARTNARLEARQRQVAERVLETFVNMVARADPYTDDNPSELKMVDALIAATQRDFSVEASPAVEGRIRLALGRSLSKLGAFDLARQELELSRARLDEDRLSTASEQIDVRNELTVTLLELGEYEKARSRIEESMDILQDATDTPILLEWTARYLDIWLDSETATEAEKVAIGERVQKLIGETVSRLEEGEDQVSCGVVAAAELLLWIGDLGMAKALVEPALEDCERRLGIDHPCSLEALRTLAWLEYFSENYGRAAEIAEIEHELRAQRVGIDHPESVWSLRTLACALLGKGELARAEPLYREALVRISRNPVPMQWRTGLVKRDFAWLLQQSDQPEEGLDMAREAAENLADTRGESHPSTITAMDQCVEFCRAMGLEEEGTLWARRADAARAALSARERQLRGQ